MPISLWHRTKIVFSLQIPECNLVAEREFHSEWKPEWLSWELNVVSVSCKQTQRKIWRWNELVPEWKSFRYLTRVWIRQFKWEVGTRVLSPWDLHWMIINTLLSSNTVTMTSYKRQHWPWKRSSRSFIPLLPQNLLPQYRKCDDFLIQEFTWTVSFTDSKAE